MIFYPVPQFMRILPRAPVSQPTAFLPAAPPPDVELPFLIMAPLVPPGWPKP